MKYKKILILYIIIIILFFVYLGHKSSKIGIIKINEDYKGVNTHLSRGYFDDSEINTALQLIKDGRIKWIRDDSFSWTYIERNKNIYDWSKADKFMNSVETYNLTVLGILESSPDWSNNQDKNKLACFGFNWWWSPPENSSDF
jgi:hypothetical protein